MFKLLELEKLIRSSGFRIRYLSRENSEYSGVVRVYTKQIDIQADQHFNYKLRQWNPESILCCVLAHEYGHWLDYQARPWAFDTSTYHYVTWMSRMDLEQHANDWSLLVLQSIGFNDWDCFERIRLDNLEYHMEFRDEIFNWRSVNL